MPSEIDLLLDQNDEIRVHRKKALWWLKEAEEMAESVGHMPHGNDSRDTIEAAMLAVRISKLHSDIADRLQFEWDKS